MSKLYRLKKEFDTGVSLEEAISQRISWEHNVAQQRGMPRLPLGHVPRVVMEMLEEVIPDAPSVPSGKQSKAKSPQPGR
jgi:hypothetical protein